MDAKIEDALDWERLRNNPIPWDTPKKTSDGGSTDYYKIPSSAKDLQDLIEHKRMNFSVGNIFKAAYRLGEKAGNDLSYDLRKIIFFAQRELDRVSSDSYRNGGPE